jgi:hypothetical protein
VKDGTARADDCTVTDGHSRSHKDIASNPTLGADRNRHSKNIERDACWVVTAGAEISMLRDDTMGPNADIRERIELGVITDPSVIANPNFPRVREFRGGPDQYSPTHMRTKQS